MTRTEARELLMKLLFQMEVQHDYSEKSKENYLEEHFGKGSQKKYAVQLINAVIENLETIDQKLDQNSTKRGTRHMAKVDLAIARLALAEILYMDNIPAAVAINEAVDMTKKYGTEESGKFINGILGQIVKSKDE